MWTGSELEVVDLPDPHAGPGQAVVAVETAGLCHSDLTVMDRERGQLAFELPAVLGHEMAGTVVEVGHGVTTVSVGDAVAGYGPRGCRSCRACAEGAENYCRRRAAAPSPMPGLGAAGALCELTVVEERYLVRTGDLDPVQAAALTDAGLTPYAAIRRALPQRRGTAVVMGVGGLGHLAVQLLALLGDVRVIAVDVTPGRLAQATALGADHALPADADVVDSVAELTEGQGADAVFDLVASDITLSAAASMLALDGVLSVVGVGSGRLAVGMHAVPLGTRIDTPFWGSLPELHEVLALGRHGAIEVTTREFGLEETARAYGLLRDGAVLGRAVVRPQVAVMEALA
jgi:alcohol dehydrogenase, propanol-preferring